MPGINLLPQKLRPKESVRFTPRVALLAGLVFLAFLTLAGYYSLLFNDITRLRREIAGMKEQLASYDAPLARAAQIETRRAEIAEQLARITPVGSGHRWSSVLVFISGVIPRDVTLSEFHAGTEGTNFLIRGRSRSLKELSAFVASFQNSNAFANIAFTHAIDTSGTYVFEMQGEFRGTGP